MVYPKYMLVNKTSIALSSNKQIFEPYSNHYFDSYGDKVSFSSPGYRHSDTFQINTVGLSGILALDLDKKDIIPVNQ